MTATVASMAATAATATTSSTTTTSTTLTTAQRYLIGYEVAMSVLATLALALRFTARAVSRRGDQHDTRF